VSATDEHELPLYGLSENPFKPRVLDPLRRPQDAELLVTDIQGFRAFPGLEALLAEHGARPVFFLLVGESGTGRTSAANYLIYRWTEHRHIESNRLLVLPSRAGAAAAADDVLYDLLIYMRNEIQASSLWLADATDKRLREIEDVRPGSLIPALQNAMRMVNNDLKKEDNVNVAAVIEQLKGFDLVEKVLQVFRHAETIVVLTADQTETIQRDVVSQIDSKLRQEIKVVQLFPLHGYDVGTLVEERWKQYSQHSSPFDRAGVIRAFSDNPRTIKRVLEIISMMLEFKQIDFGNLGLDPWPASEAQLRFNENEIISKLNAIERHNH
jgi:hypothetical protein